MSWTFSTPIFLTIQIVGEFLGLDSDKNIWFYFKQALLHKDLKDSTLLI
jgi:hypothetical protein